MARVRVHNFAMSVDGYSAGPDQGPDAPLGVGGTKLHDWVFATRFGRAMIGLDGGETGIDNDFLTRGVEGIGATVMGRNMFGPVRGEWPDDSWKGWWGDDPPYHHAVFVITHYPRASLAMEGGTTFHFVTDGPERALELALDAANGADVRVGGGVTIVQEYLRRGLIDELHVPIVPVLLHHGERLFAGLDARHASYEVTDFVSSPAVAHLVVSRIAT